MMIHPGETQKMVLAISAQLTESGRLLKEEPGCFAFD